MDKLFIIDFKAIQDNKNRDRSYGLRLGDIVLNGSGKAKGEVVGRGGLDNNRVTVKWTNDNEPREEVAEPLKLHIKCEDRVDFYERPIQAFYSNIFTGLCISIADNLKIGERTSVGVYGDVKIKRTK